MWMKIFHAIKEKWNLRFPSGGLLQQIAGGIDVTRLADCQEDPPNHPNIRDTPKRVLLRKASG